MAIALVGVTNGNATLSMPAGLMAGDLVVVMYNGVVTGLLAGFTLVTPPAQRTMSYRVQWRIAASSSETIPAITGSVAGSICHVYRSTSGFPALSSPSSNSTSGSANPLKYEPSTLTDTEGRSWWAAVAYAVGVGTGISSPPTGLVARGYAVGTSPSPVQEIASFDSDGATTSNFSGQTITVSGPLSAWATVFFEIRDPVGKWQASGGGAFDLSGAGMTATATTAPAQATTFANYSSGQYYFEETVVTSTSAGNGFGVRDTAGALFINYASDGTVNTSSVSGVATYSPYTVGDVIGVAVDITNNLVYFHKNGSWQGGADPSAGTGGISFAMSGSAMFAYCLLNTAGDASTINTGTSSFAGALPTGFSNWHAESVPHSIAAVGVGVAAAIRATVDHIQLVPATTGIGVAGHLGTSAGDELPSATGLGAAGELSGHGRTEIVGATGIGVAGQIEAGPAQQTNAVGVGVAGTLTVSIETGFVGAIGIGVAHDITQAAVPVGATGSGVAGSFVFAETVGLSPAVGIGGAHAISQVSPIIAPARGTGVVGRLTTFGQGGAIGIGIAGTLTVSISGGGGNGASTGDGDRPRRKRPRTGLEPIAKVPPPKPPAPKPIPLPPDWLRRTPSAPSLVPDEVPIERADPELVRALPGIAQQIMDAHDISDVMQRLREQDYDEQDMADIADVLALLD